MKKLLFILLLLMFSGLAFGQAANVPACNGTNGPNCTDYFGVANWANSPLPAGTITGLTLIAGGSGYANPQVVITDPTGTGATGTATSTAGVITALTGSGGTGYIMPQVTIVDVGVGGTLAAPTCGAAPLTPCGSGAMATAILGGPFTGGMLKFQAADTLPSFSALPILGGGLTAAIADTTTFSGSDFYVIGLVDFTTQLHSSLPATKVRGYCQLANAAATTCAATPSYLGPTIIAQKNRPVRVLFKNLVPTTALGGNLYIPVDTTYMGAGAPYTQNRATLHLHGGATPWISDGTPHQWTVPVGETGAGIPQRGDSVGLVPDMWFDATGALINDPVNCPQGTTTCTTAGATNDPGQGNLTFFWTNQQGGRLMFYHDHAYGITRLNVYAGEAAGYLLYDPVEEAALAAASAPGSITAGDLAHLIPLVIQDKTFVPSAAQINATDPTWAANYGTTPGTANLGDLWFPHVYMTNQNPADPGGANGFGRWDYGPWFFPPQSTLTAGPLTVPCTSSAFPGQTVQCPIPPNPSGTPEAFMDTPVVNGKAYPVLHVAPAAYRFRILSVGNDRSWNLSWFVADATQANTEVAMVPATTMTATTPVTTTTMPLCQAINPVAVPSLVLGLATGLLDATGNPMNGTGLPGTATSPCWPNYGPQPGIPAPQTMWAADGRAGGAPDPRNAGPAWIQIGSEGGLLPSPVVIPATPVNYEQNTRSITITNVAVHGLWLGPAERADVIVDFTPFAGKTLILYNDAPTPAPAIDSRLDYFTGDGDQSPIGGAPSTQPGYGPNTRTIMQVVVDGNAPNLVPFSLSSLKAAFNTTINGQGIFAATQPTTIIPETAYSAAYNLPFTNTYASIQANSLTFTPISPLTFDQSCGATAPAQCGVLGQKTIQELFTLDYGRMNATLGVELPLTNFLTQTTIPYGYIDPVTEIIKQGDTQLWKITHNGVDTHFIHFHLFNVQVINRMGWDGTIRPPDANELGWKETVRMNPLEDILVAIQPITPILPFSIPNSIRLLDTTMPVGTTPGTFTGVDPNNQPAAVVNNPMNFGWEYVWHCHILGHEENDMMRPMSFAIPPAVPTALTATYVTTPTNQVNLAWTESGSTQTSFTVQRATNSTFTANLVSLPAVVGGPITTTPPYTQPLPPTTTTDTSLVDGTQYFYQVFASNLVGYNATLGYPTVSADSLPSTSATVTTPMNAPTTLTAVASGVHAVNLAWTNNSATATGFIIQRSTGVGNTAFAQIAQTVSTATTFTDTLAPDGVTLNYRVLAYNAVSTSAPSNVATVALPLAAPSGLSAAVSLQAPLTVTLSWINNSLTATSFTIQRAPNARFNGGGVQTYTSASSPFINTTNLAANTTYYYRVQATFGAIVSAWSSTLTFTTSVPPAPTGLAASASVAPAAPSVTLTWAESATAVVGGFTVQRSTSSNFNRNLVTFTVTPGTARQYVDNTVVRGTRYFYQVLAFNGAGSSAASNTVNITP